MKNSKTFLLLSVIVAVLVLGVVYAAITTDLSITTSATVAPDGSNFNVAFTSHSATTVSNGADKSLVVTGGSGQVATLTVAEGALKTVGDYVTATYTVTNSSADLIANLGTITVANTTNDEYVVFTAEYGEGGTSLAAETGATTIIVKATLVKAPIDDVTATATVKFTATAEEA